ncbi:3 beta-hydroxysteroid dehydrogenase/Delta 5--_4-isomerase type 2-like [Mytilus californianus]|uniref:3 beta-hydroxysteroid dehydrogenase/Delta 5-->4-isomerase type 2-like n=1 Tax=Mytilus californianus TaxID=6549 RepID=UPI002245B068|nr:3 beta-hydroxysteroid dehydrogenase/Delta 5-->4-isomerase type 2-like [Mytilus californianus]
MKREAANDIIFLFLVEFEAKQTITSYTGSITDRALVQQACRGVDIVLHIASMIDWSLFPNRKILHEVNILGKQIRTIAILPLPMYGELDYITIPLSIRPFKGKTYPLVGRMTATLQYSYVGNTAMMFVKAAEAIPNNPALGGQFFFAADDTPPDTLPGVMKPFLDLVGSRPSTWHIPYWFTMFMMFLFYCLLYIVRLFKTVNLPNLHFTFGSIAFLNTTFYVTYDKAKTLLGYEPIYDYDTSIRRSNTFYSKII